MKTVYLLRHAKAEPASDKQEDINRNLAERGREACSVIGSYMKEKDYLPSYVLCSPATRTRQTFDLVTQSMGIVPKHEFEKKIYASTTEGIIALLHHFDDSITSAMVIGHNPVMHHLALTLAQPISTNLHATLELKYPTGALTVLQFPVDSWQAISYGAGELVDFFTPSN